MYYWRFFPINLHNMFHNFLFAFHLPNVSVLFAWVCKVLGKMRNDASNVLEMLAPKGYVSTDASVSGWRGGGDEGGKMQGTSYRLTSAISVHGIGADARGRGAQRAMSSALLWTVRWCVLFFFFPLLFWKLFTWRKENMHIMLATTSV